MTPYLLLEVYIPLATCLFTVLVSIYKWRYLYISGKLFSAGIAYGMIINYIAYRLPHNNIIRHYNFLIDFALTLLFYHFSIPRFKKIHIGIYLYIIGVLFWALSMLFLPAKYGQYAFQTSFENICAIGLSLVALYFMIQEDFVAWLLFREPFI